MAVSLFFFTPNLAVPWSNFDEHMFQLGWETTTNQKSMCFFVTFSHLPAFPEDWDFRWMPSQQRFDSWRSLEGWNAWGGERLGLWVCRCFLWVKMEGFGGCLVAYVEWWFERFLVNFEPYLNMMNNLTIHILQLGVLKPPDTNMIMLAYYIYVKMLLDVLHSWRSFWLFHKRPLLCWSLVCVSFILIMVIRRFLGAISSTWHCCSPKLFWGWNDAFGFAIGRISYNTEAYWYCISVACYILLCYSYNHIVYKDV